MYNSGACQMINKKEHLKISKEKLGISNARYMENPQMFSFNPYETFNLDEFDTALPFDDINRYTLFLVIKQDKGGDFAMIHSDKKTLSLGSTTINGIVKKQVDLDVGRPHIFMYKGSSGKSIKNKIFDPSVRLESPNKTEDFKNKIHIADLIIYDNILNQSEIKIQESALSMQYSISLPNDSSYYNSQGDIVFNGSIESPFNHRVTALGHDKGVNFNKLKSKNTNHESILIGSIKEIKNNSIFWADNNLPLEFETDVLKRIWKVTSTHSIEEDFNVAFDLKSLEINTAANDYILVVSQNKDFKDAEEFPLEIQNDQFIGVINNAPDKYFTIKQVGKPNSNNIGIEMSFPNPSKIDLKTPVSLSAKSDITGTLAIHSLNGQKLMSKNVLLQANRNHKEEIIFPFAGLYFITFSNDQVTITNKIFIL